MKINPPLQTEKMANRSLQRQNMRRFAHRQSGGGFGIVGSLLPIPADNAQFDYHPRVDARVTTDDCAIPDRTGQLHNAANPALAQAGWPLTGGSRRRRVSRKQRGGAFTDSPFIRPSGWPQQGGALLAKSQTGGAYTESPFIHPSGWTLDADTAKAQVVMAGGKRRTQRRKSRKQRGGACGCSGSKLMYGGGRHRRRTQRGGSKGGYTVDPSMSVGGSGPVAAPVYGAVPCDQPLYQTTLPSDPRAGAPYSLTPNTTPPTGIAASAAPVQAGGRRKGRKSAKKQRGGSYSLSAAAPFSGSGNTNSYGNGNGFPASCYAAPGSQLPTYGATTAGFTFTPSTVANGSMTPGVVAYEEVVPVAARM